MRLVAQIPHPEVRITILSWNGRFLIKFERPFFEQVFKLPESYATEAEVKSMLSPDFVAGVLDRFAAMERDFSNRLGEIQNGN